MSLYGLLVFSAIYMLAVATPGPGVAAVIARSLAKGTRGAPAFIAGFLVGDLIWFAFAATGLAALAQSAHAVFVVVKYAGAAYLLYLAYKLWTAPAAPVSDEGPDIEVGQKPFQLFLGSLALTLANPKTMIFFVALLPTVVRLEKLTLLGFAEMVVAISILLPLTLGAYVVLAARARRVFKSATAVRRINRGTGAAMACAAVAVATR
ncbi:LysE family translocator [Steroidobacter agaridevorans]|uniref:LysE family translocator n=1 Tax=Steroidobacter agaridevorans TaxID=2695856 RepID=UPI0013211923|nr:LysE family translocator [Steroidobacter agaridevorans]GFE90468.1 lysine transporter LysE [Steroidobacter agaridevorans]